MNERRHIKLLIMDVDGTLTDGKVNIGVNGEVFKTFNVKDGYGIGTILPEFHIIPAVITGRSSEIVSARMAELGVIDVIQGADDKMSAFNALLKKYHVTKEQTAYIGDDCNDLQIIRECGISACPSDADAKIKNQCDYVCEKIGGEGAVREFIEYIVSLMTDGTSGRKSR